MTRLARGLHKSAVLLPIIPSRSSYGDWAEYWVNCPRRGKTLLATCVECSEITGIVDASGDGKRFLLRCSPKAEGESGVHVIPPPTR